MLKDLFKPRLGPLLMAVVTVLAATLLLNGFLRPALLSGEPLTNVLAHERDDQGYIAHEVMNLPPRDAPLVVAIGGSAMREALPATAIYQRELRGMANRPLAFRNLSSFDQSMTESLVIVANLAANFRPGDVVVLSISPGRLSAGPEEAAAVVDAQRFPLLDYSAAARLLGTSNGEGCRIQLWCERLTARSWLEGRLAPEFKDRLQQLVHLHCSLACLNGLLSTSPFRAPRRYLQFAYPDRPLSAEQKAAMAAGARHKALTETIHNITFSTEVAKELIAIAKNKGAIVILLDLPRDPLSIEAYEPAEHSYREAIGALQAVGAQYLNLRESMSHPSADFYDLDHLLPPVRPAIAAALGRTVVATLSKEASL